jgi:hypothetical protein
LPPDFIFGQILYYYNIFEGKNKGGAGEILLSFENSSFWTIGDGSFSLSRQKTLSN